MTAKLFCPFVLMSFLTTKQREADGILDREATRNLCPYVLMSFLNRELRECGGYSKIRKFVIAKGS